MSHLIEAPRPDEAAAVGQMYLVAWLQTYPNEDAGIDETWIRKHRGSATTAEGTAQWREFIEEATRQPDRFFCRVVRSGAEVVGILCGRRDDHVTLGPMYLLNEAQGQGVGPRLMSEFLAWAGDAPVRLWVTAYNERAVRFYQQYGFNATGECEFWRGRLPNIRMARDEQDGQIG
ncbi:GNAT family N-acetyltransferase [Streptomyces sp. NPDC059373]